MEGRSLTTRVISYVSSALRWSTLATIGSSPVIKLTIIAPFLGYIVLYNEYVLSLLTLSPASMGGTAVQSDAIVYTISKINYLYFGLLLLGVASGLFSLFCPRDISKNKYVVDYIQYVMPVSTDPLLRSYFHAILTLYQERCEETSQPLLKRVTSPYPEEIFGSAEVIAKHLYLDNDNDDSNESHAELYTGSGYFMVSELVSRALSGIRAYQYYYDMVMAGVSNYMKDILYTYHILVDHSYFLVRILISILYLAGFMLLSVPTIETSYRLLRHWVFQ